MTHINRQFNFNDTFKKIYSSTLAIWIILAAGILIRVVQYIANRSLWLDEAMLSSNILNRTFSGLLQPLDSGQGAPIGFLFLEKLAVLTGGPSEYSLRFFPLLSGVIALFVLYKVSVTYVKDEAVPISVLLFSFCHPLIRYSSEVKQYSTDILIASILYLIGGDFLSKRAGKGKYIIFGLVGGLSIWFSHVSVFVLAGIGTVLFVMHLYSREWEEIKKETVTYLFWMINFAIVYYVSLKGLSSDKELLKYWADYFAPFPPTSISEIRWYVDHFYFGIFKYFFGNEVFMVAAFLFVLGSATSLVEKNSKLAALISPVLVLLIASALGKYPYGGRLTLFLATPVILLTSVGATTLISKYSGNIVILILALCLTLFIHPIYNASLKIVRPIKIEEIKPVMRYIAKNSKRGDTVYVYYGAVSAFRFYSEQFNLEGTESIEGTLDGRNDWKKSLDEIEKLRGKRRVWVLFSHVWKANGVDEEKFFVFHLNSIGNCVDSYRARGASVYLYNLDGHEIAGPNNP